MYQICISLVLTYIECIELYKIIPNDNTHLVCCVKVDLLGFCVFVLLVIRCLLNVSQQTDFCNTKLRA